MRIKLLLAQGAPRLLLQPVSAGLGRAAAELCLCFGQAISRHPMGQGTPRDCVLSMHSMGSAPDLPLLDLLNPPTISALLRCS